MRRRILAVLAALLLIPAGVKAQNIENAIAKIRKDYATASEKIKAVGDYHDNIFVNSTTINTQEMWSGSGPHAEKTEIFYSMGLNDEWSFDRTVFFVRNKYNVSVREFFTEILYDEKGKPEFYYFKAFGYDGNPYEWRFYWENGKLIRNISPKNINSEELGADEIPTPEQAYKAAVGYSNYIQAICN